MTTLTARASLFALTALLIAAALGSAQARPMSDIRADGTLRVIATADMPPFTFVEGGNNAGFEIELLTAIASDLDLKLEVQHAPSTAIFAALEEGKADVGLAAFAITSTREQKVDFSQPTLCAGVSVVSANPKLQLHTDLEGKKVGVASGTIMESYVKHLPFQKTVKVYPTLNDVTLALFSRQIDATFGYIEGKPMLGKLYPKYPVVFGPVLFKVPVGMAVAQDNGSTRFALNVGLSKVMRDGRYAAISAKYFGIDSRCKPKN
jgi:polar amino acid transport system substrate-binding protein